MRSFPDRLRHAISFEVLALLLVIPGGALLFGVPMQDFGVIGVVSAVLATLWNMLYNLIFDLVLRRRTGSTQKRPLVRVLHTVLFEIGLLVVLLPFIAWYLGVTLWAAFVMDVSLAVFYMSYAYAFNWTYDRLFPLPEWQAQGDASS